MSQPLLTEPDLSRIATEAFAAFNDAGSPDVWLEKNGITAEAMTEHGKFMASVFCEMIGQPGLEFAIRGLACAAFQIGWEAHLQTRGERL